MQCSWRVLHVLYSTYACDNGMHCSPENSMLRNDRGDVFPYEKQAQVFDLLTSFAQNVWRDEHIESHRVAAPNPWGAVPQLGLQAPR